MNKSCLIKLHQILFLCFFAATFYSLNTACYGEQNLRMSNSNSGQGHVIAVSVDNSVLSHCVVVYKLTKGEIATATFNSPSDPNLVTRTSISSGNFQFWFDQNDLVGNEYTFILTYILQGTTKPLTCTFTAHINYAVKTAEKSGTTIAWRQINGMPAAMTVSLTHKVKETYRKITYENIKMTKNSAHTWVGRVDTKLSGEHSYDLPDTYTASHHYEEDGEKYLQHGNLPPGNGFPQWGGDYSEVKGIIDNQMLPNRGDLTGRTDGSFIYVVRNALQALPSEEMARQLNTIIVPVE